MKIGILGAGQLGRMMALSALPIGHSFRFFSIGDEGGEAVACFSDVVAARGYDDDGALRRFVQGLDVLTFETENIPSDVYHHCASQITGYGLKSLIATQHRVRERELLSRLGVAQPAYAVVTADSLHDVASRDGLFPGILKTAEGGYDGRGQVTVDSSAGLLSAFEVLGARVAVLEKRIAFSSEFSLVGAMDQDGDVAFYPITQNLHQGGILRISETLEHAPYAGAAEQIWRRIASDLGHIGVLTVEFFETAEGLLVNEIAPRVHNSGHWSIEGTNCSQFLQHIGLVTGGKVRPVKTWQRAVMINLVGQTVPEPHRLPQNAHFHWYGKTMKPARKVGHVTLLGDSRSELDPSVSQVQDSLV